MESILSFLDALKHNNHRNWFDANKSWYREVKAQFDTFVEALILRMAVHDPDLAYLTVRDCTYRIYRDIRFSADKTPYKTNMGAYLVKGGKKSQLAGYYFHVEPGNCMVAGGLWMPEPALLKKIRWGIYDNIDEFVSIVEDPVFKEFFPQLDEDAVLTRPPRDFPANFPYLHYLKFKSYTVSHPLSDEDILSDDVLDRVVDAFCLLKPLNQFFNRILEEE
ncbi:MAG TPA: DUF2461 domain-containing protein [Bacteroidales bacterium]|nr:DUF2461 domain-containing protein [Bacteroidales bacterium]HPO65022.1 DUF2461 domain-containing protein [Bacteroidales bacterium]